MNTLKKNSSILNPSITTTTGNVGTTSGNTQPPPQPPQRTSSNPTTNEIAVPTSSNLIHSSLNQSQNTNTINSSNTSTLKKRVQIQEVTV